MEKSTINADNKDKSDLQKMPISKANEVFTSKLSLYYLCCEIGYYLPKYEKPMITTEYLLDIFTKKIFSIRRKEVRIGFAFKKLSKAKLIDILEPLANSKPIGFDELSPPDRTWLINCIYTLKPEHSIFKYNATEVEIEPERAIDFK